MTIDIKNKQRAFIEVLLLEAYAGEEILMRLRNGDGSAAYRGASIFKWISEVRRGNEEPRNEGRPERPYQHETNAAIRAIRQKDLNASLRAIA